MTSQYGTRNTRKWRRAREIALMGATHCAVCGGPLDFAAPSRSKWAPSVDHIVALAVGGDPFDQSNLRVTHYGCNSSLGASLGNRRRPRVASPVVQRPRRATWW
jgi:5-methylcytosine-specific restriction endonuclease McrA